MRPVLIALLLTACAKSASPPPPPPSPCAEQLYEGSAFMVCDPGKGRIEIVSGNRSFASLQAKLGKRADQVAFAMNAGMFDDQGKPIGLMIEGGRQVHAINRRTRGFGNFHIQPNGVFLVRGNGREAVVTSQQYRPSPDISFATQSGPMLLVDGKPNPRFDEDGQSHFVRNGVGMAPDGEPIFVISLDAVSFGRMARFMRDRLGVRDALYFDGSVSSLWDPANGRMDDFTELGPIVVAFKPIGESAPRRAGHATP